ncbi:MAG: Uma2 family endonuclease [Pirellulaceae bacterium]|nr:Uma2 family endonuclease [Pirellulaceae bacterium]
MAVTRHLFTAQQYHEMIEHGIFKEDEPIELIRGEIIRKLPIGNPHAATVNRLNRLLSKQLADDVILSIQNPIWLGDSEPEPDVAILHFREDLYSSRRPMAEDVLLLVEVADSSLAYDREIKGDVYAQAGISEYWIVNLNQATIEVYLDPQSDGRFATVITARSGDTLKPRKVAGLSIEVSAILG